MSRPCSSLCQCINCSSAAGVRPLPPKEMTRKRRNHMFQVEVPSCKRFATDRGEVVSETISSDFESIVLHEICLKMEDIHSIL